MTLADPSILRARDMPHSLESWAEALGTQELPVLRHTAAALARLSDNVNELTAAEIASVVHRDPLMTAKVLSAVNSMHHGRVSSEITTVEHAVMMFGLNPFFSRFERLATVEQHLDTDGKSYVELMKVMARAHHAAHLAWDWAVLRQDVHADEVSSAALLLHTGEMMLWCCAPEQGLRVRRYMHANDVGLLLAFREALGFDLWEFQLALGRAWHLPEMYLDCMEPQNVARPRVQEVVLAESIARQAVKGWYGEALRQDMEEVAQLLNMGKDEGMARIHQQSVVVARDWERYGVPPAAAWLPMLPGPWPKEERGEEPQAPPPAACLAPHPGVARAMIREIEAHLDGTLDLHDLMALALKGMHEGLGLDRVLFALFTPDRRKVKAKYVLGAEADSPLRRFEFDLTPPGHLFARLMGKMQGLWLSASNREKLEPLLLPAILETVGDGEFYAMSVHAHNKPVGLFYADRKHGPCALDSHNYEEFKTLCLKAAQGLAHLTKPAPH